MCCAYLQRGNDGRRCLHLCRQLAQPQPPQRTRAPHVQLRRRGRVSDGRGRARRAQQGCRPPCRSYRSRRHGGCHLPGTVPAVRAHTQWRQHSRRTTHERAHAVAHQHGLRGGSSGGQAQFVHVTDTQHGQTVGILRRRLCRGTHGEPGTRTDGHGARRAWLRARQRRYRSSACRCCSSSRFSAARARACCTLRSSGSMGDHTLATRSRMRFRRCAARSSWKGGMVRESRRACRSCTHGRTRVRRQ